MLRLPRLLAGAAAGVAAAFVMKQWVNAWDRSRYGAGDGATFGLNRDTDARSANAVWQLVANRELPYERAAALGNAAHYAIGAAGGIAYVQLTEALPQTRAGFGTAYGFTLWIADEASVTLSGLESPFEKTPGSHGSALTAHLIYALVLELSRRRLLHLPR